MNFRNNLTAFSWKRFQATHSRCALVRAAEYYRDILGFQIVGYWDGERVSLDTDAPLGLTHWQRSSPHAVSISSTVPKTGSTGSVS